MEGVLSGNEMVDVRVTVYDGSFNRRRLGDGVHDRGIDGSRRDPRGEDDILERHDEEITVPDSAWATSSAI